MNIQINKRGFENGKFIDSYNNQCSIQKSSSAMDDFIWLGIDNPKLTVFKDESMGQYLETTLPKTWVIDSRMHLSRKQVAELLPILQEFVNTGNLSKSMKTETEIKEKIALYKKQIEELNKITTPLNIYRNSIIKTLNALISNLEWVLS